MQGDAFDQKRLGFQLVDAEAVGAFFFVPSFKNCIRIQLLRRIYPAEVFRA